MSGNHLLPIVYQDGLEVGRPQRLSFPAHSFKGEEIESSVAPKDIFGHLVSIFGNKDLFVAEYRTMLAERLLQSTDFAVDKEVMSPLNAPFLCLNVSRHELSSCLSSDLEKPVSLTVR